MPSTPDDELLSRITTMWTVLRAAHAGPPDAASAARQLLLERYVPAVRRYLTGLLRDAHAAEDLTQEFALLVVSGKFHGADPARGRFRSYVKTALFHLVATHARYQKRSPVAVAPDSGILAGHAASADDEQAFAEVWRIELFNRTWAALADANPGYHTLLRLRADHPEESSEQLAARTRPPVTAANLRQTLRRARDLFTSLLREEVAHTLDAPNAEAVDEELAELGLLKYTQS
jgi:RNA polymerase sigma-70 factor (ECF subfamily)